MKLNLSAIIGLCVVGVVAASSSVAQQNPTAPAQLGFGGRGGRRGGFGGPGGQFGQGGPGALMARGANDHNPLVSHVMELINRTDVQTGIHLDLKQRNALAQYQQQSQESVRQQMQQMFQNMRTQRQGGGQPGAAPQAGAGGAPDPTQRQQMLEQMQRQRAEIQAKLAAGLNDLLRPDQVQRLHEIDLQWRGALSIADAKVADEVQVSQEHKTSVAALVTEYQTKASQARQELFAGLRRSRQAAGQNGGQSDTNNGQNGPGATGGAAQPGQPGQPGQSIQGGGQINMANLIASIQKADDTARKDAEDKALELLSPEEKGRWTAAIGKPFTFRTDLTSTR